MNQFKRHWEKCFLMINLQTRMNESSTPDLPPDRRLHPNDYREYEAIVISVITL